MTAREWARMSSRRVLCQRPLESGLNADRTVVGLRRHSESELLKLSLNRPLATREIMRCQRPEIRMLESVRCTDDGLGVIELSLVRKEVLPTLTEAVLLEEMLSSKL